VKAIVLLSGGIDSTVALAEAVTSGRECSALVFNYQQHAWLHELDAAAAIARHYGIDIAQCHIDGHFWRGASYLTGGNSGPAQSYVPARNLLLLSHGIAAAESQGAREVWYGPNADDAPDYPDCTEAFVEAVRDAARTGTVAHVNVVAPHIARTKADVIARGLELGAPLHLTTSCAGSGRCGVCKACVLRRKAYAELGLEDPCCA